MTWTTTHLRYEFDDEESIESMESEETKEGIQEIES